MFTSKIDKFLCFVGLHALGVFFGIRYGITNYAPFAAAATLALGLAVKPAATKEGK